PPGAHSPAPPPAAAGAPRPTTVSPDASAANSVTGAPPARLGEFALGGRAGISSALTRISLPCEVTTPRAPRALVRTADTTTSCAARGPAPAAPRPAAPPAGR